MTPDQGAPDERQQITVCSACLRASCFAGWFCCEDYRSAGTVQPWREAGERGTSALLWTARDGRPLSNRTWGEVWRGHVRDLAVPYHSPHVLRHSGASWLAQAGVPMQDIQRWLGHGDPASTRRYAHLCPAHSNATIGEALAGLGKSVSRVDRTV